ncbi:MAG: putative acyl-CoA dehydrogenase [Pseudomonas sp.]|jgi:alkylation response protein AidB-like acyl-CoA dehydrogenase|uniref:acyl-CoA dehydrogenase family protein n=1 Tax=Pseudomonas sp. TaxID=306 RepID=UPI0026282248|nr:acyl-CoA dehydrogenase family protein [Pseudomonas sp.]MDB6049579.1 putative acyl-CoA dehydrogenase [Pseudomonas sp.]
MGHVMRTPEQLEAVESFRRFLSDKIDPVFNKEYRDKFVPKEKMAEVMRQLSEFGMVSGAVSEANGGLGLDWPTMTMLFEEVAACSVDLSTPVVINSFGAQMLEKLAPDHLRERYLPGLISGDSFVSVGISEPDVGSNVLEIKTRARRDGDDYIITGEKTWISNGSYSDFLICTCRTGEDPRKGLTHFLLDRKEHPYEVQNIHKMAWNSQSTAQIFLNDVRVPASNIIGGEGQALKNTLSFFERSRVFVAAQGLGIGRRALEEAVRYAKERKQHGKLIAGHQLISAMLAEMATNVDAARLLTYRAAEMIGAGIPAEMEAAMAKYFACEAAVTIARQAVQIHGGAGVTTDFLVEKLAREAIIVPIPEGTTQIQQLIIGRALTGVNAF